jgi:prepilin-type N-terminal cleavage/methylation domain-containing protein
MKKINHKSRKGFTLIELMVVIVLIGILSGVLLGVINISGMRSKARDAQRVADLKKIQTALELYFADNRAYVASAGWGTVSGKLSALTTGGYIAVLPTDPSVTGTGQSPCAAADSNKNYWYKGTVSGYVLTTTMEVQTSALSSQCTNLINWTAQGCSGILDYCYGVENPF